MTTKTKKTKAAGRYGAGYGTKLRTRLNNIEGKQRKRQKCPFCGKEGVKRLSKGIWKCPKCNKKFASDTYYLK